MKNAAWGPVATKVPATEIPELRPGQSVELLKELHILARDGRLNQDSRRKLKQVSHLSSSLNRCWKSSAPRTMFRCFADHGAGKSTAGLHSVRPQHFKALGARTSMASKPAPTWWKNPAPWPTGWVLAACPFLNLSVAESTDAVELPDRIDIVTALHACDTATDDVIAFGLQKQARAMVIVPVARGHFPARDKGLAQLAAHAWLSCGAILCHANWAARSTVLRCLYLEGQRLPGHGDRAGGLEHSMKNELIIARYTGQKKRSAAQRLVAILEEFGLLEALGTRFPVEQKAAVGLSLPEDEGGALRPLALVS